MLDMGFVLGGTLVRVFAIRSWSLLRDPGLGIVKPLEQSQEEPHSLVEKAWLTHTSFIDPVAPNGEIFLHVSHV